MEFIGKARVGLVGLALVGCSSQPYTETRGETANAIIGGAVDQGDPSVVAVYASQDGSALTSTCTGSVIAPTVVLTAAHCITAQTLEFTPKAFFVVTAVDGLHPGAADLHRTLRAVAHPGYDPVSGENDLGVVILAEPLATPPLVVNHDPIDDQEGSPARIVGYGQTISGNAASANTKREASIAISGITARHFVVGDGAHTQCHGDSGGPVLMSVKGQTRIVGLSWRTITNGDCNLGSMATRVDPFARSFIDPFLTGGPGTAGRPATPPAAPPAPPAPPPVQEPAPAAQECGRTINCNDGDCSCGSGRNIGRSCDKDSGECDRLCAVCD